MSDIAVVTTFPNASWEVYSHQMLQSFVENWPAAVPIMIQLDDELLVPDVQKLLRKDDVVATSWQPDHKAFVERNKGRDDPSSYRKQPVRFCHKVFAIKRAMDAIQAAKANKEPAARYLIWLDADVHTLRKVTLDDLKECLPKEGDAVAYMGRKDWDHSECGWLAFDLEKSADLVISTVFNTYVSDKVLEHSQQHDSWIFDRTRELCANSNQAGRWTNLTPNATGRDVWGQSPMGKWSTHYKGPEAKARLARGAQPQAANHQQQGGVRIQTKNALPDAEIRAHIEKNQSLITHWIRECQPNKEEIVVVSAGPMLVAEEVRKEVAAGKKIVAVKHALTPLKAAGIKPWACILLDPRPHVADFVKDADPDVLWFVASQVDPMATMELLARGCRVFGYHAAVNAGEEQLTNKQLYAVVSGGSATATRGLYMLNHLGFSRFKLYGYDLSIPDKPDLNAVDEHRQPKFLELSIGMNDPLYNVKRLFFSEPQLIAQFEEINEIMKSKTFELEATGYGVVPFILNAKRVADLRRKELKDKMSGGIPPTYEQLLWNSSRKTKSLTMRLRQLLPIPRRPMQAISS